VWDNADRCGRSHARLAAAPPALPPAPPPPAAPAPPSPPPPRRTAAAAAAGSQRAAAVVASEVAAASAAVYAAVSVALVYAAAASEAVEVEEAAVSAAEAAAAVVAADAAAPCGLPLPAPPRQAPRRHSPAWPAVWSPAPAPRPQGVRAVGVHERHRWCNCATLRPTSQMAGANESAHHPLLRPLTIARCDRSCRLRCLLPRVRHLHFRIRKLYLLPGTPCSPHDPHGHRFQVACD
jgi:hypothetical protein